MKNSLSILVLGGAILLGTDVHAQQRGNPGSMLLFPEYDTRPGMESLITVTNANSAPDADILVEFRYIEVQTVGDSGSCGDVTCLEFNRIEALTPNDTFTTLATFHQPSQGQGYLYVIAEDPNQFLTPVSYNHLIGQITTIDGFGALGYTVNGLSFSSPLPEGVPTDLDADGRQDLDGVEYEAVPDEIHIPRFFGQGVGLDSELILISLSGGQNFQTVVNFLVYNDNEEVFSTEQSFRCWNKLPLLSVSGLFNNGFLQDFTNDDPSEVVGAPNLESGWMRISGALLIDDLTTTTDPAVLAFLIEGSEGETSAGLPFGAGANLSGLLNPPAGTCLGQ